MLIAGGGILDSACAKHRDWCSSLNRWCTITENAHWHNFAEVRQTFGSASQVTPYVIFNIAGNKARLVTVINYEDQIVGIESVLAHAEYDRKDFAK